MLHEPQTSVADPGPAGAAHEAAALLAWGRRRAEDLYAPAEARPIHTLGVLGAGIMGSAIATAAVRAGVSVTVTDTRPEALAALAARTDAPLRARLTTTADPGAAARCDLVIETVVEDLWVKEKLLAELEPILADGTVLGTNTSTISIGRLGARLADPARLCGIHFFLPVDQRPLVEVVRGPQSGRAALATAVAFARRLGKAPLVAADSPGFLVNRLMFFYLSEALQLAAEGAPVEQIDRAAEDFGWALGPLALMDCIGLDVVLDCAWVMAPALGERLVHSPVLVAMVKRGRLGRKTGAGFYSYELGKERGQAPGQTHDSRGKPVTARSQSPFFHKHYAEPVGSSPRPDPEARALVARWAGDPVTHTPESVLDRLHLPMLLEATRLMEEGSVAEPREVDLATVAGFGFPASRGGLLAWADAQGAARLLRRLGALAHLGPRVLPTPLLREMAAQGKTFHPEG